MAQSDVKMLLMKTRTKSLKFFLLGVLLGLPALLLALPLYSKGLIACCGLNSPGPYYCTSCPSCNCCISTCDGDQAANPGPPCNLINCHDQCWAVFGGSGCTHT